jgi:hypothetical protein
MTTSIALLLAAAGPCSALWEIADVTRKDAPKLGIEVRAIPAGPNDVRVVMELKTDGELKGFDRVELRLGEGEKVVTTALKEDRSKPGRVVVSFTAARDRLDQVRLWVMVPGADGGTVYDVRVKEFVEPEKGVERSRSMAVVTQGNR